VSDGPRTVTTDDSGVIVRSSGGALTSSNYADAEEDEADADEVTEAEASPPPPVVEELPPSEVVPTPSETDVAAAPDDVAAAPENDETPAPPADNTSDNAKALAAAPGLPHDASAALTSATTIVVDPSDDVQDTDQQTLPTQRTAAAPLVAAAATTSRAPFSLPRLPTPGEVFSQIKHTVTKVFTQCACAIANAVQGLVRNFSSLMAPTPGAPTDPAQTNLLWSVAGWVRRQIDFAVVAFNRSPLGQLVQQVTTRVTEFIDEIGTSPAGREFSARVAQFLAECDESTGLPAEFDRTIVVGGLNEPTDFAILADPNAPDEVLRILITEKSGAVRSYDPATGLLTTLVSVPVVSADGERGLIGIELDPNFWAQGQEGYHSLYVAYTTADNYDRLSKFTVNETLDGATETVLVTSDELAGDFHHGGELAFDPQGQHLYWALGNNTNNATSQDLSSIHGKILRINRDGTAPTDNPFVGNPDADPRVWAYGFRNPFRFTFTPDGKLLAGDVGEASWEELNLVTKGGNYGWPDAEGACDGCGYVDPIFVYPHSTALGGAGSITSVAVYTGATYPDQYQNRVFIADYSLGWIKVLNFDSEYSSLISQQTFDSGAGAVVKLAQGPNGNLYQLNIYPGTLSVITPSGGNRAPTAVINASETSGAGDSLEVQFSAGDSTDPDGDNLTYQWNFGDGRTSNEANPTVVFSNTGAYTAHTVTLTVSDGEKQGVATQRIVVGSTPPDATITVSSDTYSAGDTINFSALGMDAEDSSLPASAYTWTVEFHHADHKHPFRDNIVGPTGSITIPRNADQLYNTFYRINLAVTDSSGLTTTRSVDVRPNLVTLTFGASDPDATFTIDGIPHTGSYSEQAVVGVQRTLNAPSPQYVRGQQLVFGSWSDGGAQSHTIITPGASTSYQVLFTAIPSPAAVPSPAAILT
jgi:glucose/arabinose dehydrogenase